MKLFSYFKDKSDPEIDYQPEVYKLPPGIKCVPLDLHQFRSPISASIGAVTISKFALSIEEGQPRDCLTGKTYAAHLAPRVSQLFLDSMAHVLSIPMISIWPLHKPSKWGLTRLPLVRMIPIQDEQTSSLNVLSSGGSQQIHKDSDLSTQVLPKKPKIKFYRLQTLWPRVTWLELSPPSRYNTNSCETSIEITGGILHSRATPLIAQLQLQQPGNAIDGDSRDGKTFPIIQAERGGLLKKFIPNLRATIVASGNERLVFDTSYLGRIAAPPYGRMIPSISWWSGVTPSIFQKKPGIEISDSKDIAVFQFSSRLEFPPTSLDFYVVGPSAEPTLEQSIKKNVISKFSKNPTSSMELVEKLNEINLLVAPVVKESEEIITDKSTVSSTLESTKNPFEELPVDKRWPGKDSRMPVLFLWVQRQSQQIFIGLLLKRFHRFLHENLPIGCIAPLKTKEQ